MVVLKKHTIINMVEGEIQGTLYRYALTLKGKLLHNIKHTNGWSGWRICKTGKHKADFMFEYVARQMSKPKGELSC